MFLHVWKAIDHMVLSALWPQPCPMCSPQPFCKYLPRYHIQKRQVWHMVLLGQQNTADGWVSASCMVHEWHMDTLGQHNTADGWLSASCNVQEWHMDTLGQHNTADGSVSASCNVLVFFNFHIKNLCVVLTNYI